MKKIEVTILCDRCGTKMPHGTLNTNENVSIIYYDVYYDGNSEECTKGSQYNMCSTCVEKLDDMLVKFIKNG